VTGGDVGAAGIDWDALRAAAREISTKAYVPYSHYRVGAAALTDDDRIVVGCNVENASYGLTLCAECSLISSLFAGGGGRLVAFACVDDAGEVLMPCGRCRQLLWEHGGPDLLIDTPAGILPMTDVLPMAFGPEDLHRVRDVQDGPS
jgi:cytidine deaminase